MDNYKFYQIREKFSNESKDTVQECFDWIVNEKLYNFIDEKGEYFMDAVTFKDIEGKIILPITNDIYQKYTENTNVTLLFKTEDTNNLFKVVKDEIKNENDEIKNLNIEYEVIKGELPNSEVNRIHYYLIPSGFLHNCNYIIKDKKCENHGFQTIDTAEKCENQLEKILDNFSRPTSFFKLEGSNETGIYDKAKYAPFGCTTHPNLILEGTGKFFTNYAIKDCGHDKRFCICEDAVVQEETTIVEEEIKPEETIIVEEEIKPEETIIVEEEIKAEENIIVDEEIKPEENIIVEEEIKPEDYEEGSNKDESIPVEETKISKNSIPLNYLIVSSVFIVILIIIFLYFKTFM